MGEVRLRDIGVAFRGHQVLDAVGLDVRRGALTAVLGPSGCGKTTLLRVVAGFLRPDTGTVEIAGHLVCGPGRDVPPERRGVGVVPQEGALFPHLSVAENVGFGLSRRDPDRARRIEQVLDLLGVRGCAARRPDELSGGQQQRVALARALAPRPRVVVLDEPFSALDAGLRATVRSHVREALQAEEATALLVTHDQDEALSVADEVAVLDDGTIVDHGTAHRVYSRPGSLSTARFVGDLVELAGWWEPSSAVVQTILGTLPVATPGVAGPPLPAGTRVVVGLRPEQLQLVDDHDPTRPVGVVRAVEYHGHDALVTLDVDTSAGMLAVRARGPVWPVGARVGIRILGPALVFPEPAGQS